MKRLIILQTLALACASCMWAAPRQTLIPGHGHHSYAKAKTAWMRQHPARLIKPDTNLVAAPPRMVIGRSQAEMIEVDRVTSYDAQIGEKMITSTIEYDQYGFRAKETVNNGDVKVYTYSWLSPGKVWSSKSIKTYSNGSLSYEEKDERTFHPNGSVATRKVLNEFGVEDYYEYDANGYMVLHKDGQFGHTDRWTLIPGIGKWIKTWENDISKQSITLDGDFGYTIEFYDLTEEEYRRLHGIEGHWYNAQGEQTGYLDVRYGEEWEYENGYPTFYIWQITDLSGERTVTVDNGTSYEIVYEHAEPTSDKMSYKWVPTCKYVCSSNYETPWIYADGQTRSNSYYNYEDDKWTLRWTETYSWVNAGIVKEVYTEDDETTVSYYQPDQTTGELGDDIYYNETSGDYAISTYDDGYCYYTYYDAAGNVVSRYREFEDSSSSDMSEWSVWDGASWAKCEGTHTIYEDSDDHYVITFDAQGRPAVVEEYEEGILDTREEYEYTADGYIRKSYCLNDAGVLKLDEVKEYSKDPNGVVTQKYTEYDDAGNVTSHSGEKYDPATGIHYSLSYADGQWSEHPSWVEALTETLADGTVVRTERMIDENGNLVNSRKELSLITPTRELTESYSWNTELNMWIGDWKSEKAIVDIDSFDMIVPDDPIEAYEEYFYPYENPDIVDDQWTYAQYEWDHENNTGWFCSEPIPVVSYPDAFTQKIVYSTSNSYGSSTTTITATVDDMRRIVGCIEDLASTNPDTFTYTSVSSWEYDDKGRLSKTVQPLLMDLMVQLTFHYGTIEIVNGVDDIISSEQDRQLTVYNLQGVCVMRDAAPEALRSLPRGIYIVNGRKVAVR